LLKWLGSLWRSLRQGGYTQTSPPKSSVVSESDEWVLTRTLYAKTHTEGHLQGKGMVFQTIERPWLDNQREVSCIPTGKYRVVPHNWNGGNFRFAKVWLLQNVPNRDGILIHVGNTVKDVIGCIAVGMERGTLGGQPAVLSSSHAIDMLRTLIGEKPTWLTIVDDV
jgi:hypothetical protein